MPAPASGGAAFKEGARLAIRMARKGCTNRPFYHIVVQEARLEQYDPCIEQLGTYDPLPNQFNEKLVALNCERLRYWIGKNPIISKSVREVLGLSGFFPIHPSTYETAWKNRREALEPEKPLPAKLTWRERKKILLQEAEKMSNTGNTSEIAETADEEKNIESASVS